MTVAEPRLYGCADMTSPLRRVLVRRPGALDRCRDYGWRATPDAVALAREHEALCALLAGAGAEVVVGEPLDDDPDAVYTFDPALVVDDGALVLRPGKKGRRCEQAAATADLERIGIPVRDELPADAYAEGGDFIRLDERTLLAGRGYRTNSDAIWALERLTGLETLVFDLPHWRGPEEVMHLLSLLSPLDTDLAVAYLPLLPVRLAQLLAERGIGLVEVPDEEFDTLGANVLALAPRVALMRDRNVETRRRLERAGVEVLVYAGEELSKGDGGPTCLTCPVLRAA